MNGPVVYNYCWSSPAQSFSGPSPVVSWYFIFSDSRLLQPGGLGPRIYIPQGTGLLGYTPRHWIPSSSPPTTRGATVELFDTASTRDIPTGHGKKNIYLPGSLYTAWLILIQLGPRYIPWTSSIKYIWLNVLLLLATNCTYTATKQDFQRTCVIKTRNKYSRCIRIWHTCCLVTDKCPISELTVINIVQSLD
jgi:hypothetical protein